MSIERESESCASQSDRLRFNLSELKLKSPAAGIVIVNPVQNRALTDEQICENERLVLKRIFKMSQDKYEFMSTGNQVPYYREATNRLGLSDLFPCEGAAIARLRKTFYDF